MTSGLVMALVVAVVQGAVSAGSAVASVADWAAAVAEVPVTTAMEIHFLVILPGALHIITMRARAIKETRWSDSGRSILSF